MDHLHHINTVNGVKYECIAKRSQTNFWVKVNLEELRCRIILFKEKPQCLGELCTEERH
jgi:hypothetical protein